MGASERTSSARSGCHLPEFSAEITARQPLQLHIELSQGVAEALDEFVRSRRHDLEVVAMLESMSDQKGIIALALLRGADGNFVDARRFVALGAS